MLQSQSSDFFCIRYNIIVIYNVLNNHSSLPASTADGPDDERDIIKKQPCVTFVGFFLKNVYAIRDFAASCSLFHLNHLTWGTPISA